MKNRLYKKYDGFFSKEEIYEIYKEEERFWGMSSDHVIKDLDSKIENSIDKILEKRLNEYIKKEKNSENN